MTVRRLVDQLCTPLPALTIATVVGSVVWWIEPAGPEPATMLGITLFCIVLWILTPIPPSYTGIICIGLVGVVFSPDLALVGFHSPATWLIGFGLLVGEATRRSGLASWAVWWLINHGVPARVRDDPVQVFRYLLFSLTLGSIGFALLVPSILVRVLVLAPILRETGAIFDSRKAQIGLFLAPLFATFYGSTGIYTAGLQNVIIVGITESVGGPSISWAEWTGMLFPLMALARSLLIAGVLYLLYRPPQLSTVDLPDGSPETTGSERRMLLFLVVGVGIWTTDVLHGLHPLFGAIVVVILAFFPLIGVAEFSDAAGDIDYSIFFFLGGIFAIGEGLAQTGFADFAVGSMLAVIPSNSSFALVLLLVFAITVLLMLLLEGLVVASVITPLIATYAAETGLPVAPIMMTEAIALTTLFFPYQSAILVAILAEDVVDASELTRVASILSIASLVTLVPLQLALFVLLY